MNPKDKHKREEDRLKRTAICPKCFRTMPLEGHHIFPVKFYGRKNNKQNRLFICHDCHKEITNLLPEKTRLTEAAYLYFHKRWMEGKQPNLYLP